MNACVCCARRRFLLLYQATHTGLWPTIGSDRRHRPRSYRRFRSIEWVRSSHLFNHIPFSSKQFFPAQRQTHPRFAFCECTRRLHIMSVTHKMRVCVSTLSCTVVALFMFLESMLGSILSVFRFFFSGASVFGRDRARGFISSRLVANIIGVCVFILIRFSIWQFNFGFFPLLFISLEGFSPRIDIIPPLGRFSVAHTHAHPHTRPHSTHSKRQFFFSR